MSEQDFFPKIIRQFPSVTSVLSVLTTGHVRVDFHSDHIIAPNFIKIAITYPFLIYPLSNVSVAASPEVISPF